MSVINKMLSDLDQRKEQEQGENPEATAFLQPEEAKSSKSAKVRKLAGIIALLVGVLVLLGAYWVVLRPALQRMEAAQGMTSPPAVVQAEQDTTPESDTESPSVQPQPAPEPEKLELVVLPKSDNEAAIRQRQTTVEVQQNNKPQAVVAVRPDTNKVSNEQQNQTSSTPSSQEPESSEDNEAKVVITPAASSPPATKQTPNMQMKSVKMTQAQRVEKRYDEAQKLAGNGMIRQAIDKYRQVLTIDARHLDSRVALAALYYGRQEAAQALAVLDKGLSLQPDNIDWSLMAAKIHHKQQNYGSALYYLQLPVDVAVKQEYVALRADTLQRLQRYDDAVVAFRRLSEFNPANGRWWLGLGLALEGVGKTDDAIIAYRRCLTLGNIAPKSRQYVQSRLRDLGA